MKVSNNIFIITGAAGGIGSELVLALLKRGAKVAAVDVKQETLNDLKNKAEHFNTDLSLHVVDITDRSQVMKLPEEVIKIHGHIDGIINNAGIIQPFVKINDLEYSAIEKVMNVNFYGTLYMTKAFLPHLLDRPEAYIVNVSSMGGFLPVPGQAAYGASKAAVKLMTEGLFAEMQGTNVHVSVVFPGATDTNISGNSGVSIAGMDAKKQDFKSLPADKAADIIVRGMLKNKPQIFTGKDSKMMNKLYRLNPVFATKLIAKQMKALLSQ